MSSAFFSYKPSSRLGNIKCLLFFMALFLSGSLSPSSVFGQSLLLQKSTKEVADLNTAQTENIDRLIAQDIYSDYTIMEIHVDALHDDGGIVNTQLGNFFDQVEFKSFLVNYEDDDNFSWSGKFFAPVDTIDYSEASMTLVAKEGVISGFMQSGSKSYQIIDLSGGLFVLAEFDGSVYKRERCLGANDDVDFTFINAPKCGQQKTRILFIYTQNGANLIGNSYQALAFAALADLHVIWANSQVNNVAEIAGVRILPSLHESGSNNNDLSSWSINSTVTNWRNETKADIVVFMTHQYPAGQALGKAKSKSGLFEDGFILVAANLAVNGNHIFAHEVNHIYGADHQSGPLATTTIPYAHAHDFKTGAVLGIGGTRRYTNMYQANGALSIQHLSNPDVKFQNKATGTSDGRNNARKVREAKYQIANHYDDMIPFGASISIVGHGNCQNTGKATAVVTCGKAPFTYQWSYSDNGIIGVLIPGSSTSINTLVPLSYSMFDGTYGSRTYHLKVTDALGYVTFASMPLEYFCPPLFEWGALGAVVSSHTTRCQVYPNPSSGNFKVDLNMEESEDVEVTLSNVSGRQVASIFQGRLNAGSHTLDYKGAQELAAGIYFININGKSVRNVQKVFIY